VTLAEAAAFVLVGAVFVRRLMGLSAPMLPVDLLRRPIFALSVATAVASFVAQSGAYVAIPVPDAERRRQVGRRRPGC
jgi:DHA2 family multidrug resistance protein-like MFS transporter